MVGLGLLGALRQKAAAMAKVREAPTLVMKDLREDSCALLRLPGPLNSDLEESMSLISVSLPSNRENETMLSH